ncbi:hypothetical protein A2U01_0046721, partial [Trifolium medium]|nr:hypothetical protein [Trifolium medium]
MGPQGESEDRVLRTCNSSCLPVSQERHATRKPAAEEFGCGASKPLRSKRVIFSASKRSKRENQLGQRQQQVGQEESRRRKAGGLLRHPLH